MAGLSRFRRLCASALMAILAPLGAGAATIGFEDIAGGAALTNQIAGVTFSNALVLEAGVTLNEIDFPPHGGTKAVVDDSGPMTLLFDSDITSFSAFFTYAVQLSLQAYDATGTLVDSASSLFAENYATLPGNIANEAITLDFLGGIRRIVILGDQAGFSFVMDDASYVLAPTNQVPEPATLLLAAAALALAAGAQRRGRRHA